jgi:hypothetical protein
MCVSVCLKGGGGVNVYVYELSEIGIVYKKCKEDNNILRAFFIFFFFISRNDGIIFIELYENEYFNIKANILFSIQRNEKKSGIYVSKN